MDSKRGSVFFPPNIRRFVAGIYPPIRRFAAVADPPIRKKSLNYAQALEKKNTFFWTEALHENGTPTKTHNGWIHSFQIVQVIRAVELVRHKWNINMEAVKE